MSLLAKAKSADLTICRDHSRGRRSRLFAGHIALNSCDRSRLFLRSNRGIRDVACVWRDARSSDGQVEYEDGDVRVAFGAGFPDSQEALGGQGFEN
jgi:hypothetical protein